MAAFCACGTHVPERTLRSGSRNPPFWSLRAHLRFRRGPNLNLNRPDPRSAVEEDRFLLALQMDFEGVGVAGTRRNQRRHSDVMLEARQDRVLGIGLFLVAEIHAGDEA